MYNIFVKMLYTKPCNISPFFGNGRIGRSRLPPTSAMSITLCVGLLSGKAVSLETEAQHTNRNPTVVFTCVYTHVYICIYVYACTYTYIYIYNVYGIRKYMTV